MSKMSKNNSKPKKGISEKAAVVAANKVLTKKSKGGAEVVEAPDWMVKKLLETSVAEPVQKITATEINERNLAQGLDFSAKVLQSKEPVKFLECLVMQTSSNSVGTTSTTMIALVTDTGELFYFNMRGEDAQYLGKENLLELI